MLWFKVFKSFCLCEKKFGKAANEILLNESPPCSFNWLFFKIKVSKNWQTGGYSLQSVICQLNSILTWLFMPFLITENHNQLQRGINFRLLLRNSQITALHHLSVILPSVNDTIMILW